MSPPDDAAAPEHWSGAWRSRRSLCWTTTRTRALTALADTLFVAALATMLVALALVKAGP